MWFFQFCQFRIRNMDAPIDHAQLHYLPFHPVTNTCIYLMSMESPIRYALSRCSILQDESELKNLGPLAFALKSIVMHSNKERDDIENNQFFRYVGLSLTRQTLAYYKSAINEEINFTGYMSGTKEEDAINDAFVC